jgi:hypothetical protein
VRPAKTKQSTHECHQKLASTQAVGGEIIGLIVLAAALTSDVTVVTSTAHACESLAATCSHFRAGLPASHMVLHPFSNASMHDSGLCGAVSETVATNRCNKCIGGTCMHGTTEGIEPASGRPVPDRPGKPTTETFKLRSKNFVTFFFFFFFVLSLYFHCLVLRLWGGHQKAKDPTNFLFIQDRAVMLLHRSRMIYSHVFRTRLTKTKPKPKRKTSTYLATKTTTTHPNTTVVEKDGACTTAILPQCTYFNQRCELGHTHTCALSVRRVVACGSQ